MASHFFSKESQITFSKAWSESNKNTSDLAFRYENICYSTLRSQITRQYQIVNVSEKFNTLIYIFKQD
jgi:hypothetical protein